MPVFVKQLGARPTSTADRISHRGNKSKLADGFYRFLNNRKGADPAEWPEDLRVQELPCRDGEVRRWTSSSRS